MTVSELAMFYLHPQIPYKYGGESLTIGIDCSAFVNNMLRSVGLLDDVDYSSQMLFDKLKKTGINTSVEKDSILFFGEDTSSITHTAIAIDCKLMVESAVEGTRVRPISRRSDLVASVKLRY